MRSNWMGFSKNGNIVNEDGSVDEVISNNNKNERMKYVYVIYCEGTPIDVKLTEREAKYSLMQYYCKELYSVREVELVDSLEV